MNKIFRYFYSVCALAAFALMSQNAFAWFKICNNLATDGMYVSYGHYIASTTKVRQQCGDSFATDGCNFNAWRVSGWWYIEPSQCVTVLGGDIKNRFSYVYVDTDSGTTLANSNTPLLVSSPAAFTYEEQPRKNQPERTDCWLGQIVSHCTPTWYSRNFAKIDSGNNVNFTLNIN